MKSEVYDITNKMTRISFDDTLEVKRRWKELGFYYYGINFEEQELTLASHGKSKQVKTVPYNDIVNIAFDVAKQRAGGEGQGMSGAPWSTSLEMKIVLNNGEKYGFYQYEVVETILQLEHVLATKNVSISDSQNLFDAARAGKKELQTLINTQIEHPGINIPKK